MNPFMFVIRRPVATLMMLGALVAGGVFVLNKMRGNYPPDKLPKVYAYLDNATEHAKRAREYVGGHLESVFGRKHEEHTVEKHKIFVTSPLAKDVEVMQQYVCLIRSQKHIEVCALDSGYLEEITVREGQAVKKDDPMFKIVPILYKAKLKTKQAEVQTAHVKFTNTEKLYKKGVVSDQEVALAKAELERAQAEAELSQAEFNFTNLKAPFPGIVDRLQKQLGSLIKEGEVLTTLSDNSVMWVYFNVTERRYLEYMDSLNHDEDQKIELKLADGSIFPQAGKIGAIEAKFNPETGNIPFRADFPNPKGLLRHGQTGTILIHRVVKDAVVIPQRSTFENLAKRYVYIVDKDDVVHQSEITIQSEGELDDIFIITKGVKPGDKIVLEGIRQIHEGEKVEFDYRRPEDVMANQKVHAE